MRTLLLLGLSALLSLGCRTRYAERAAAQRPPNVLLIFTDDQGFGDLACYGHPTIATPHLDRLAAGGVRATQFYVGAPVCSPSRAALLTGCYPIRVGMHRHVVFPGDDFGLDPSEETIAELLRERGYATGCFGKWHLGHRRGLLPSDQGFDRYEGVPYSNDMAQFHRGEGAKYRFRLPWMNGEEVVEWEPDQRRLTERQTDAALAFIDDQAGAGPFFAYVPYSMPHIPLFASTSFEGQSARGLYGDVIEEIDASVGRLLDALARNGVLEETLVIFTSDNGPWLPYGVKGGSAGPLRDGKGTNFEGGQRVPFIASWPGQLPAGHVTREVFSAMDLLPTITRLAGARLPRRKIDGSDRWSALVAGAPTEPDSLAEAGTDPARASFLYYSAHGDLTAIRRGSWKLWLESGELFDVEQDVGERHDRSKVQGEVVQRLRDEALEWHAAITRDARPRGTSDELVFDPLRPVLKARAGAANR